MLRARLDAMQAQLADAHATLQAATATATERRAAQAEQGRDAERTRADVLRDRVEAREADLALIRAALDQTQAEARKAHAEVEILRQAEAARRRGDAWRGSGQRGGENDLVARRCAERCSVLFTPLMFVRFRQTARRLQVSLTATPS